MDIQFKNPFNFQLEILESDDHIPSVRTNVYICIEQFQSKFQYEGVFWIECAAWNDFLQALRHPSMEAVSLHDMNNNFALSIKKDEKNLILEWRFEKKDVDGRRQVNSKFLSFIDDEVLAEIRQPFEDFPVWW